MPDSSINYDATSLIKAWTRALWILEALPPARRPGLDSGTLRERKLIDNLDWLWMTGPPASSSLMEPVAPSAPFHHCLRSWAAQHDVPARSLTECVTLAQGAHSSLLQASGSVDMLHAALLSFAAKRADVRDSAFDENSIRLDIVRRLQGQSTPDI